jgi:hypothetical protein
MSPKIANLIAAELGILIGLGSWMVYTNSSSNERTRETAQEHRSVVPSTVATAPVSPTNPAQITPVSNPNPNAMPSGMQQAAYQPVASQPGYYPPLGYTNAVYQPAPTVITVPQVQPIVIPVQYVEAPAATYDQPAPTVVYADPGYGYVGFNSYHFGNRCAPRHGNGSFRNCGQSTVLTPGMHTLSQGNMGTRVLSQAGGTVRGFVPGQGFNRRGR